MFTEGIPRRPTCRISDNSEIARAPMAQVGHLARKRFPAHSAGVFEWWRYRVFWGVWLGFLLGAPGLHAEMEPVAGVDAQAILRRMVVRAQFVAGDTNRPACVYTNTSRMETLDSSGVVKRTKEKIYEVTVRQGMTQNRVVAVDGRWLTPDEIQAQSEKENRWRETYAGGKGGSSMERMDQLVNERLIRRFEFTVAGRERLRGKLCWVLDFRPLSTRLPEDRLIDRVINLLHGRVWIDVTDDEIVRADVRTEGTLRLWGGFLGSLETFQLHLDREKSAFDVWYNRHAEVTVRARKLFSPVHVRLREIGGGIRNLP